MVTRARTALLGLSLAGCHGPPALAPWAGTHDLPAGTVLTNTCPAADDALADALGVDPAGAGAITVTVEDWMGELGAHATWCPDAACEVAMEGWATYAAGALAQHDTYVFAATGCDVTVELALVAHCADPEDCASPTTLVDAEVTRLDGDGCAAFEASLQAASTRADALLGCDVVTVAAEAPVSAADAVAGRYEAREHVSPYDTGPASDATWSDVGWWLHVDDEARRCDDADATACDDDRAGPVAVEAGLAVWRGALDFPVLGGRSDVDCTVHEDFLALLVPAPDGLALITDREQTPAPAAGDDCEVVWDQLQMGPGTWDPDTNADVIDVAALRAR